MIMSHQKMAQDLKSRKLFYRAEPSSKTLAKLQRIVDPPLLATLPAEASPPPTPITIPPPSPAGSPEINAEASAREVRPELKRPTPVIRRSNTVRIYVPFEKKSSDEADGKDELDVTTRRIEIDDDHYVPRLMRMNAATRHSTPQLELHCTSAQTLVRRISEISSSPN